MNNYTSYATVEVAIDDEQFEFLMARLSENLPEWIDSMWATGYCQWNVAAIDSRSAAIDTAGFIYAVSQILSRKHVWFCNDIWNDIVSHAVSVPEKFGTCGAPVLTGLKKFWDLHRVGF